MQPFIAGTKTIVAPLADANQQLSQSEFPDFNDAVNPGDGKENVERLTNLVAVFEGRALDFSKNRADGDDIPGNTLSSPKFLDGDSLKQFDDVIANPPFSDNRRTTGLDPLHDPHDRRK